MSIKFKEFLLICGTKEMTIRWFPKFIGLSSVIVLLAVSEFFENHLWIGLTISVVALLYYILSYFKDYLKVRKIYFDK